MSNEKRAPVEYEVLEKSLIGNELFEAGQKAMYDGLPAENLKPLCAEGEARAAEFKEGNAIRVAKMIADNSGKDTEHGIKDPTAFFAAFLKEQAASEEARDERLAGMIGAGIAAALAKFLPGAPAADVAELAAAAAGPTKRTKAE